MVADLGQYAELCDRLRDGGVPATLQHDDLHDANVFVSGNRHRFFDWGDASVSHPFLSLLVSLHVARQALSLPSGHPVLLRLRDVYLYEWREHGTPEHLREQRALTLRVGPLQRALTWRRILAGRPLGRMSRVGRQRARLDGGTPAARHPDRRARPRLTSDCTDGRQ